MQSHHETGGLTASASKAGMDHKAAAKYIHGVWGRMRDARPVIGGPKDDPLEEVSFEGKPQLEATIGTQKNARENSRISFSMAHSSGQVTLLNGDLEDHMPPRLCTREERF